MNVGLKESDISVIQNKKHLSEKQIANIVFIISNMCMFFLTAIFTVLGCIFCAIGAGKIPSMDFSRTNFRLLFSGTGFLFIMIPIIIFVVGNIFMILTWFRQKAVLYGILAFIWNLGAYLILSFLHLI